MSAVEISVLFIVTVLFMTGLWMIDISASALITGNGLANMLGSVDPNVHYHLGLFVVMMMFSAMTLWKISSWEGRKE